MWRVKFTSVGEVIHSLGGEEDKFVSVGEVVHSLGGEENIFVSVRIQYLTEINAMRVST